MVTVQHALQSGTSLHDDKRVKEPVRVASTATVSLATPGASMDGVTLSTGNRVLLKNQSTGSQNGIYIWTGAASPLTRSADADEASDFFSMFIVGVREGTVYGGTYWVYTNTGTITLGTTALTFSGIGLGTITTEFTASDFAATGLTGATGLSRYAGAVTAGVPPATGTFLTGDFVVDRVNGGFWVCTNGGTPGTWRPVGSPGDVASARIFLASNYS